MDIGHVLIVIFKHVLAVWNTVWTAANFCPCRSFDPYIYLELLKISRIFLLHIAAARIKPLLHRERPHIKSCSFLTNDFKNLNSVGVP
jgi:hypothetical protein